MSSTQKTVVLTGVIASVSIFLLMNFTFWHIVKEGHIGFYYRFGRLISSSSEPGLQFKLPPPITRSIQVYIRPQVDSVSNVKCGASDGTSILFSEIEIGNTLPPDYAHFVIKKYGEEYDQFLIFKQVQYIMNGICSRFTSHEIAIEKFNELDDFLKAELEDIQKELKTGIGIGFVRIAKPMLPRQLDEAYQRQASERALKKAKEEEFKRIQQENLNEEEKVRGISEREVIRSKKQNEINIAAQISKLEQQKIENEILLNKVNTDALIIEKRAEAKMNAIKMEAVANLLLLTDSYLEMKKTEAIFKNSKLIFGSEIPKNVFLSSGGSCEESETRLPIVFDDMEGDIE